MSFGRVRRLSAACKATLLSGDYGERHEEVFVWLTETIYTVYIRYLWQVNHQIYGHIQCTMYIYGSGQP